MPQLWMTERRAALCGSYCLECSGNDTSGWAHLQTVGISIIMSQFDWVHAYVYVCVYVWVRVCWWGAHASMHVYMCVYSTMCCLWLDEILHYRNVHYCSYYDCCAGAAGGQHGNGGAAGQVDPAADPRQLSDWQRPGQALQWCQQTARHQTGEMWSLLLL